MMINSKEDQSYADTLNKLIRRPGASDQAAKTLSPNSIQRVIDNFHLLDPYIQAIIVQSVINLKIEEFNKIAEPYAQLIELANQSENEWVKRTAFQFKDYPIITPCDDINTFDLSAIDVLQSAQIQINPQVQHFKSNMIIKPPSASLPPPKLPERKPENTTRIEPERRSLFIPENRPTSDKAPLSSITRHVDNRSNGDKTKKMLNLDDIENEASRNKGYRGAIKKKKPKDVSQF
ncbi:hypothetical protein GPJ56_002369 [Histomonas meleagridis]|uniref:uncharacterized protein n=1 Tax=Histomonas meleagridis TaxID=135588 RepID=UPI003559B7C8|nr:hypothetical protein GPJ56_002369 [Histomonas meleagridis]KAH0801899.1 hypothetical protein GO595_005317 [Histomonas meleagridis]